MLVRARFTADVFLQKLSELLVYQVIIYFDYKSKTHISVKHIFTYTNYELRYFERFLILFLKGSLMDKKLPKAQQTEDSVLTQILIKFQLQTLDGLKTIFTQQK